MKRLIIGDIHGCYEELQELLAKAALSSSDEIIALGDVVDRGPDSPRVLEFFREQPNARSLLGNHERKHVRSSAGEIRPALSQLIARSQIGEAAYPDACAFMENFDQFVELPEAILVHGFFEPGIALADQRVTVIVGTLSGQHYLEKHYDRNWYELYHGDKPLIVGHHDYLRTGGPLIWKNRVFCIDTGCCDGRALTGILLPDFHILSVPSRDNHWVETRRSHAHIEIQAADDDALPWERLERLIGSLESRPEPTAEQAERIARLRAMHDGKERILEAIHDLLMEENARILAELRTKCAFDQLSPAKQGSLYAATIGGSPPAKLLHAARKGQLSLDHLRRKFKTPRDLFAFAAQMRIECDGSEDED